VRWQHDPQAQADSSRWAQYAQGCPITTDAAGARPRNMPWEVGRRSATTPQEPSPDAAAASLACCAATSPTGAAAARGCRPGGSLMSPGDITPVTPTMRSHTRPGGASPGGAPAASAAATTSLPPLQLLWWWETSWSAPLASPAWDRTSARAPPATTTVLEPDSAPGPTSGSDSPGGLCSTHTASTIADSDPCSAAIDSGGPLAPGAAALLSGATLAA
jgi:hypothetical protein